MNGRSGFLATANQVTTVPPRRSNQRNRGRERSTTRHVSLLKAALVTQTTTAVSPIGERTSLPGTRLTSRPARLLIQCALPPSAPHTFSMETRPAAEDTGTADRKR